MKRVAGAPLKRALAPGVGRSADRDGTPPPHVSPSAAASAGSRHSSTCRLGVPTPESAPPIHPSCPASAAASPRRSLWGRACMKASLGEGASRGGSGAYSALLFERKPQCDCKQGFDIVDVPREVLQRPPPAPLSSQSAPNAGPASSPPAAAPSAASPSPAPAPRRQPSSRGAAIAVLFRNPRGLRLRRALPQLSTLRGENSPWASRAYRGPLSRPPPLGSARGQEHAPGHG